MRRSSDLNRIRDEGHRETRYRAALKVEITGRHVDGATHGRVTPADNRVSGTGVDGAVLVKQDSLIGSGGGSRQCEARATGGRERTEGVSIAGVVEEDSVAGHDCAA